MSLLHILIASFLALLHAYLLYNDYNYEQDEAFWNSPHQQIALLK